MKIFYIGCKPRMNAQGLSVERGGSIDVSDKMATNLLKITGFVTVMTSDAKVELKRNKDRETKEKSKLESGIVYINNDEEVVALRAQLKSLKDSDIIQDLNRDIERLTSEAGKNMKEISRLSAESKEKSILIAELTNEQEKNEQKTIEDKK